MKDKKLSPRSEDNCCCNLESGTWQHANKKLNLLLLALSYVLGQVHFSIYATVDLTLPLCIMLAIALLKGNKERPAADLQGIFSLIPINNLTKPNLFNVINIFRLFTSRRSQSISVI